MEHGFIEDIEWHIYDIIMTSLHRQYILSWDVSHDYMDETLKDNNGTTWHDVVTCKALEEDNNTHCYTPNLVGAPTDVRPAVSGLICKELPQHVPGKSKRQIP
jgi:hypothetical protein